MRTLVLCHPACLFVPVKCALEEGLVVVSGGGLNGSYHAVQFHFHWGRDSTVGSEHTINGVR